MEYKFLIAYIAINSGQYWVNTIRCINLAKNLPKLRITIIFLPKCCKSNDSYHTTAHVFKKGVGNCTSPNIEYFCSLFFRVHLVCSNYILICDKFWQSCQLKQIFDDGGIQRWLFQLEGKETAENFSKCH